MLLLLFGASKPKLRSETQRSVSMRFNHCRWWCCFLDDAGSLCSRLLVWAALLLLPWYSSSAFTITTSFSANEDYGLQSSFTGKSVGRFTSNPSGLIPRQRTTTLSMKLKIGLLGLPNVGKSSLFNGLARKSLSLAANYPFATIEPHRAIVPTPDDYLDPLSRFADSVTTVPATMEWVDVAGLAKGAHRGEGLGNQFLGTLRQCSALCHVVRMFEDPNVIHVDGVVDPAGDADVIMLELLFADMEHVQRRLEKINVPPDERSVLERILKGLEQGEPARSLELTSDEELSIRSMGLLTLKPVMYALNIDEVDFTVGREEAVAAASEFIKRLSFANGAQQPVWALVSAKIEAELAKRDMEEQSSYFTSLGADAALAERLSYRTLPLAAKHLLKQKTFYTGPGVPAEKSRTCKSHLFSSISALQLANRLHGDIGKGFICAEVTPAPILLNYINYNAAKEAGVVRMEGKQYEVQECDVVLIRWKG